MDEGTHLLAGVGGVEPLAGELCKRLVNAQVAMWAALVKQANVHVD